MIAPPACYERQCKHYIGVKELIEDEEGSEVCYCTAFPNGIPFDIAEGIDLHSKPTKDQENKIVFEK